MERRGLRLGQTEPGRQGDKHRSQQLWEKKVSEVVRRAACSSQRYEKRTGTSVLSHDLAHFRPCAGRFGSEAAALRRPKVPLRN